MSRGSPCGVRSTGVECRKFVPNIFNKSKCSSCFKQKEEHSTEALESNRATRKISKCGYLFVAPGWDFSNPLNRTKRWQRRWFVLYDDGELTYSVDEHPETVPQARIDMTRVLEVAAAEDITEHPYSLAITSPEGITFIKGTCREETRWWADVFQVYARNKGRHKRNATFPGGQSTILQITPTARSNANNQSRPRFNSCRSEPRSSSSSWIQETTNDLCSSVFSSIDNSIVPAKKHGLITAITKHSVSVYYDHDTNGKLRNNVSSLKNASQLVKDNAQSYITSSTCKPVINYDLAAPIESSVMTNKTTMATMLTTTTTINTAAMTNGMSQKLASSGSSVGSEKPPIGKELSCNDNNKSYIDQPASSTSPPTRDKLRAEDKVRKKIHQRTNSQQWQQHQLYQQQKSKQCQSISGKSIRFNEKLDDDLYKRIFLEHEREQEGKLRNIADLFPQTRTKQTKPRTFESVEDTAAIVYQDKLIRGDPDGCGLDISSIRYSPISELRASLPSEDLLNVKKGWLMKQSLNTEWNKYWFVLRGCGLLYYRDPGAEDKGIMDGIIDLNTIAAVTPVQVARNYGFQTVTWNEQDSTIFSAITAGIRTSWITAIRRAANLPDLENSLESHIICQETQQDINTQVSVTSIIEREKDTVMTSTSVTPRSILFSSDEEYRTASEGGRRESGDWSELLISPPLTQNGEWSSDVKALSWSEDQSRKHEWSELPPSPPLTRTALSRVKARSRSSSRSRVYKRSRSSPPSSRRSTLDSIKSEDLVMACYKLSEAEQGSDLLPVNESLSKSSSHNPLIIDVLGNQLTMLRNQIDSNQSSPNSLLVIIERQENEIKDLKSQLNAARTELLNAENKISKLIQHKTETVYREKQIDELLSTVQITEEQRNNYLDDLDKMKKLYSHDKELLENKLLETETILQETTERFKMLTNELSSSHVTQEHLQAEITTLSDRLAQGIEENERLYTRVRELEDKTCLSSSRDRGRSFDSLSDLTNIDLDINLNVLDKEHVMEEYEELRSRFEKAILEIRAMRKELREAYATQDALELQNFAHKQEAIRSNESNQAQSQLMAARIQDLTNKLANSEKQMRTLKQKLNKVEARDKRRSLSLKGRESFQISQEVEDKLLDLENRIHIFEQSKSVRSLVTAVNISKELNSKFKKEHKEENLSLDRNALRRKSLDSATCSEPLKVLIRLSTLETKVVNITESIVSNVEKDFSEYSEISISTSEIFLEIFSRLKKLERAVAKSKRRLEKCLGSKETEKAEKRLQAVNEILNSCIEYKKNQANSQITESIGVIVSKLESILRDKMCELMKKHQQFAQSSELNDKEKMKLIAERVAFEFILLKQIKCAMEKTLDRNTVLSELVETSQLISNLKFKINGTKSTYQNTSYIQYLTRVLANKLVLIGGVPNTLENSTEVSAVQIEGLNFLIQKQKEINEIVINYKNEKLRLLAEALAVETFNLFEREELGKQVTVSDNNLIEDKRIREAWLLAQETISKELVRVEVSRFIMHSSKIYEQNVSSVSETCLDFDTSRNIDLKSLSDKAQNMLKQEMEYTVHELKIAYQEYLIQLKKNKGITNMQYDLKQMLSDYTNVIAQKILIDSRIILLQERTKNKIVYSTKTFVSSLIEHEDILSTLFDEKYTFENNPIHDTEFIYFYQQFSKECEDKIVKQQSQEQIKNTAQILTGIANDIDKLKECLKNRMSEEIDSLNWPKLSVVVTDWVSICDKCSEIHEQIKRLTNYMKNMICKQCEQLQHKLEWLTSEYTKELQEVRKNQEKNLIDIKGKWDNQRNSLTTQYEHEAVSLRERARKLEHRLNTIDSEHSLHINEFQTVCQKSVTTELDTDAKIRKRYKEEIKQLRALCEKGLLAMENSHRRIISELEEKHHLELENLRIEKEQALSEETQATLAALDAMRKAHEHEVKKEIAKFKQEFIKQVQTREDIGVLHKEHEEEMKEIKKEILSLSAKYSSKCVESAALEEKVGILTKQVAQAQQHILQLDIRNKQLRTHLVLEANDSSFHDTIQFLINTDDEIDEQQEKIHLLRQQLKHRDDSPRLTNLSRQSTALSYLPVYSSQEIVNSLESITEASKLDEVLLIDQSKNFSSQLKKPLSTDQSESSFFYSLERVKSESFLHPNNIVTTESISNNTTNKSEKAIKVCNSVITPLLDSLKSRNNLHQYQGTEENC